MITLAFSVLVYYFFSQVTQLSGFGGVNNLDLPGLVGDPVPGPGAALLLRRSSSRVLVFLAAARTSSRTPFGLALQGLRDEPARMRALGFNVTRHRIARLRARGLRRGLRRGPVGLVQPPHLAGVDQPRRRRSTS